MFWEEYFGLGSYLFYGVVTNRVPDAGICRGRFICTFLSVSPGTPFRTIVIPGVRVGSTSRVGTRGDVCVTGVFRTVTRVSGRRGLRGKCHIIGGYNTSNNRAINRVRFRLLTHEGLR